MTDLYKIARKTEWDEVREAGTFTGSADDKRDGFIHLSSATQLRATYDRYYSDENNLLLLVVEAEPFGPALIWEESRLGEKFPHLYVALPVEAVRFVMPILRRSDGRPIFPPGIP